MGVSSDRIDQADDCGHAFKTNSLALPRQGQSTNVRNAILDAPGVFSSQGHRSTGSAG